MKTIEVILGGQKYAAALLTITEYRRAVEAFLEVKRASDVKDLSKLMACLDRMVEILHTSLSRAGSTATVEMISGATTPAETVETLNAIMFASASPEFLDAELN